MAARAPFARAAVMLACTVLAWGVAGRALAQGALQGLRTDYTTGASPYSVALADLDGTGHTDMVVANFASSTVSVFFDDGPGRFNLKHDIPTGTSPRAVVLGDVNADGQIDIVTANAGASSVSVLLGRRGGTFANHVDYPAGTGPRALALGDVNGDGRADLAVANYLGGTVSVLLNDGFGHFLARTDVAAGNGPSGVAIADIDGDGRPDLVVANAASSTVSVLVGDGRGHFARRTNFLTGAGPVALAVGDVNGDGRPDCVTANYGDNTVSVLVSSGAGTFLPHVDVATGLGPLSVVIADADGDGIADIVTANGRAETVSLLAGAGDGSFGAATDFVTGSLPVCVVLGDLNGDGRPDIVTANSSAHTVSVNYGTYAGAFGPGRTVPTGSSPRALVVTDVDGDGLPDAVVTNYASDRVSMYHGLGDGTFTAPIDLVTGAQPLAVAVGDLDSDGHQDLVVANAGDSTVSVFMANGYGGFKDRVDYEVMDTPCAIEIGDVIGNSFLDLVVVNQAAGTVSVLMGLGDGTFAARSDWDAGSSPRAVAIGDMNTDGLNDLLVTDFNGRNVSILLSTFSVGFAPRISWGVPGLNPYGIAVVDLNHDHYLDVVVANVASASVSVLLGNGSTSYRTAVDYPAGTGARSVSVADVNDDGNLDLVVANGTANTVSILLGDGRGNFASHSDFPAGAGPWDVATLDPDGVPGGHRDIVVTNFQGGVFSVLAPRSLTTTTLVSDPDPSVLGAGVTLTATVSMVSADPRTPTGSARFFCGTTLLGSAPLQGGRAVLPSPPLPLGLGALSAAYSGDATAMPSLAPAVEHRVYRCMLALGAATDPDTAFEGDVVTIDAAGVPSVTSLRFGGVLATDYTLTPTSYATDSARVRVVATVPIGALSGPVRIECPCGSVSSADVVEVRKTFGFANTHTGRYGWLLGIGWPVAPSLADTLGVPLADLGLAGRSDADWRVKTWNAAAQGYESADRLHVGQGYWIQTRNPWRTQLVGTVTRETTLVLPMLSRGWYLFGNPFSHAVSTANLRVLKRGVPRPFGSLTDVQSTVYAWNEGAARYEARDVIGPGGLFWVRRLALTTAESLLVYPPSIAPPPAPEPVPAAPPLAWSVRLGASQDGAGADTVTLGSATLVTGAAHPLTAQAPPASPEASLTLSLEAPDAEGAPARYACLIGDAARRDSAWTLVIDHASAPGEVTLALAADGLPPGTALRVSDPLTGDAWPLLPDRAVTLAALAPLRRLRLELVPANTSPEVTSVADRIRAYPNPFALATGFWFSHGVESDVRVSLYDLAGRRVRVLERRAAPAGENVLLWDGRDALGEPVPASVYFARCEAGARRQTLRVVRVR